MPAKKHPVGALLTDAQFMPFLDWCAETHPEVIGTFLEITEKHDRLAALEATIAEAVEAANKLREELGVKLGPASTKPRKPRAPKPAEAEPVSPEPDIAPVSTIADIVTVDETVIPADVPNEPPSDDDFEEFTVPADNDDDEF